MSSVEHFPMCHDFINNPRHLKGQDNGLMALNMNSMIAYKQINGRQWSGCLFEWASFDGVRAAQQKRTRLDPLFQPHLKSPTSAFGTSFFRNDRSFILPKPSLPECDKHQLSHVTGSCPIQSISSSFGCLAIIMAGAEGAEAGHVPEEVPEEEEEEEEEEDEKQQLVFNGADLPEIPELLRSRATSGCKYLDLRLSPMHTLEDIFQDLASKAMTLGFAKVLKHLGERPLRVATVCSGTESPILAMEMIQKGLGTDQRFRVLHAFSCEIVPFKQAYIQRNFEPPVLFQDILELGEKKARTAYGSLEPIPGDLDILIAGTACVDFSILNNKQKLLEDCGESGSTFNGLLRYAKRYRPRLILLENVCTAPWDEFAKIWAAAGYLAVHQIIDSKEYYIPQTRRRGYMVAMDTHRLDTAMIGQALPSVNELGSSFRSLMQKFIRRASSPAGMFLLPEDDRRLEQIQKDLATRLAAKASRVGSNWDKFQLRHENLRAKEKLGGQRPISRSQAGGMVSMPPDFYWRSFFVSQTERVWESLDINFLMGVAHGIDTNYKERWFDTTQGVDRAKGSSISTGVIGCVTPKGMPFLSTRGGPLSGLEALSLQGLPLDRIILTRESQRDLQDLAGNAMTSTVVGAAMLSALILGYELLDQGEARPVDALARTDDNLTPFAVVDGDNNTLIPVDIEDSSPSFDQQDRLLQRGAESAQFCFCEGQSVIKKDLVFCNLCGHRACDSCAGNPTHAYRPLPAPTSLRSPPLDFIKFLKGVLPMRLMLSGLSVTDFENLLANFPVSHPPNPQVRQAAKIPSKTHCDGNLSVEKIKGEIWHHGSPGDDTITAENGADLARQDFIETVQSALAEVVRFYGIQRSDIWTVVYEGDCSRLQLQIRRDGFQWLYFAKAPRSAPAQCLMREIVGKPIARLTPTPGSLLDGSWEISAPISAQFPLWISGIGDQMRAYEAEIGIKKKLIGHMQVWTQILVEGDDDDAEHLDADIRGLYTWLPDCGTALASLYKKEATAICPAVYLFLDPNKTGNPIIDSCVFSFEHNRLAGYSRRITIAELSHKWRASAVTSKPTEVNAFYRAWTGAPAAALDPVVGDQIVYRSLQPGPTISLGSNDCRESYVSLVSLAAPAASLNLSKALLPSLSSPSTCWEVVSLEKSNAEIRGVAWAVQKIASRTEFRDWNNITVGAERPSDKSTICHTCDPPAPGILWGRDKKGRVIPYEDPRGAAVYERAAKSKPAPFVLLRRIDEAANAELRFALNIQSLAHQAYGQLGHIGDHSSIEAKWRLIGNTYDWGRASHPRFRLLDNKHDNAHHQPPNFQLKLRPEQLRSLGWMVSQEDEEILPFVEEETEEAHLPLMSWRAEVKVSMPRVVRGGVLCDEVGYGKTAIILAVIDAQYEQDSHRLHHAPQIHGLVATKATLLVVPFSVYKQWADEIGKFLGTKYKVLSFSTTHQFSKISVKQIREADIILVPWSLFNSPVYYRAMQYFTGTPKVPDRPGRSFDSWFKDANTSLREVVSVLQDEGPEGYLQHVWARRSRLRRTQANSTYVPSCRLRGAALAAAQARAMAGNETGTETVAHSQSQEISCTSVQQTPDCTENCPSPENPSTNLSPDGIEANSPPEGPYPLQAIAPDGDSADEGDDFPMRPNSTIGNKPAALEKDDAEEPASKKHKRGRMSKTRDGKKQPWDDREEFNIPAPTSNRVPSMDDITCMPLHAFSFNRVVVDEYTYSNEERNLSILSLVSRSKWILSGTPALGEFADVKSIARHLGIHLGVDNDGDILTSNPRLKAARRNYTTVEAFRNDQPPRSNSWYDNRCIHAQRFLDRFARQNIAAITAIPMEEEGRVRKIPGADLDILHTVLNGFLTNSSSPSEALIKCCTSAMLTEFPWGANNCIKHISTQQAMRDSHREKLEALAKMASVVLSDPHRGEQSWQSLLGDDGEPADARDAGGFAKKIGDKDTVETVRSLFQGIFTTFNEWSQDALYNKLIKDKVDGKLKQIRPTKAKEAQLKRVTDEPLESQPKSRTKPGKGSTGSSSETAWKKPRKIILLSAERFKERLNAWKTSAVLKDLVRDIFMVVESIVASNREIRFFTAMRRLQIEPVHPCDRCAEWHDSTGRSGITIIRTCGHRLCQSCMEDVNKPEDGQRVCVATGCRASACESKQINGLCADIGAAVKESSKLDTLVDIIKGIPTGEKALLFVQFEDTMIHASRALAAAYIDHRMAKNRSPMAIMDFVKPKATPVPRQLKQPKQSKQSKPSKRSTEMVVDGELEVNEQELKRKRGSENTEKDTKDKPIGPKVLILLLGGVMAAGLNLQCANHILFLSPLLASTQHDYEAGMTQAIGRSRRCGQKRTVHTYHLLTRRTAEVTIFQERTSTTVIQRGVDVLQVAEEDILPTDERCEGDSLDFTRLSDAEEEVTEDLPQEGVTEQLPPERLTEQLPQEEVTTKTRSLPDPHLVGQLQDIVVELEADVLMTTEDRPDTEMPMEINAEDET
ncbi:uncharacterized protein N7482_010491 [Penicillium canariense]|uniref:Helicase ATP-binding domain-containing protein n=1 Tax=Penicillium canariense TaxID=189055 RepID=A0A9W9LE44_9EURO|nr:uncharacterized protein N7482_010491 [Penicillium canariense]KAJ5151239.1 hypothetical protein N7482_010491 [Penicillium canariense]